MARKLSFDVAGATLEVGIEKLDRSKVYGWVDKKPVDAEGRPCHFGALSPDGAHLFGAGSFETGHVSEDGTWLERGDLLAVNAEGEILEKRESSFKGSIALETTVSINRYLEFVARLVYQLEAPPELLEAVLAADGIYTFPYNYTAGFVADDAFLVENDGTLFLVVGEDSGFEFVSPDQVQAAAVEDDDEDEEEDLDFGMF